MAITVLKNPKRLIKFDYNYVVLWLGNSTIGGKLFLKILGIKPAKEMKEISLC
jgi:hypothetical protein